MLADTALAVCPLSHMWLSIMLQAFLQAMRVKAMKQEAAHADQLQLLQSQLKEIAREKEVLLAHDRVQVQMGRMETAASESSGKVSAVLTRLAAAEVR